MKIFNETKDVFLIKRSNIVNMIKELDDWCVSMNIDKDNLCFEIFKYPVIFFGVRFSIRFIFKNDKIDFMFRRILDTKLTIESIDRFEIDIFKLNVIDYINHFSRINMIHNKDIIGTKVIKEKIFFIRNGESLIQLPERQITLDNVDNIYSLVDDDSEQPQDSILRIKKDLMNKL